MTTSLSLQRFFFHPPARPPSNFIVRSVCEDVSSATHVPFLHLVRGGGFTTSRLLRTVGSHTESRCLLHAPLAVGFAVVSSSSSCVRSCLVPPWEPSIRPVWNTTPGCPTQCSLWGGEVIQTWCDPALKGGNQGRTTTGRGRCNVHSHASTRTKKTQRMHAIAAAVGMERSRRGTDVVHDRVCTAASSHTVSCPSQGRLWDVPTVLHTTTARKHHPPCPTRTTTTSKVDVTSN